jgi:hypothetical protein
MLTPIALLPHALPAVVAWIATALGLVLVGVWTTPATYTTGETMTASLLNAQLRDNLLILKASIDNAGGVFLTPVYTAMTGTKDDYAPGLVGSTALICTNATLLTINGMVPGEDGQRLVIVAVGAGNVALAPEALTSLAANRFTNYATASSAMLSGGSGSAEYVYGQGRWRMIAHEQGAWLPFTSVWSAVTTAPAIGNGTITGAYWLKGRTMSCRVILTVGSTTTFGTGAWQLSLPTAAVVPIVVNAAALLFAGTGYYPATGLYASPLSAVSLIGAASGASIGVGVPVAWVAGNVVNLQASYEQG